MLPIRIIYHLKEVELFAKWIVNILSWPYLAGLLAYGILAQVPGQEALIDGIVFLGLWYDCTTFWNLKYH